MKIFAAVIIIVFAVAFFYVIKRIVNSHEMSREDHSDSPNILSAVFDKCEEHFARKRSAGAAHGTILMTKYTILVYDGDGKRVISRSPLPDDVEEFSIGRSDDNDVCINDARVSECHARIGSDKEGLFYRDNHSTNGTRKTPRGEKITGDIDIVENLVLYLGPRKIMFVNSESVITGNEKEERFCRLRSSKEEKEKTYEGGTRVRL